MTKETDKNVNVDGLVKLMTAKEPFPKTKQAAKKLARLTDKLTRLTDENARLKEAIAFVLLADKHAEVRGLPVRDYEEWRDLRNLFKRLQLEGEK